MCRVDESLCSKDEENMSITVEPLTPPSLERRDTFTTADGKAITYHTLYDL